MGTVCEQRSAWSETLPAKTIVLRNTIASWGAPAKFFHWAVAALILTQFPLGWLAASWRISPTKLDLFVWHKSFGMLVLALTALRLAWRLGNRTPALPPDMPRWEHLAARIDHLVLYAFVICMPVTGWVINSAANIPFKVFWFIPLPAITQPDKRLADLATLAHFGLFIALAAVLVVHIGAALRHHFVKRNDVLARMLPGAGGKT
jgi:cytochrome b561